MGRCKYWACLHLNSLWQAPAQQGAHLLERRWQLRKAGPVAIVGDKKCEPHESRHCARQLLNPCV